MEKNEQKSFMNDIKRPKLIMLIIGFALSFVVIVLGLALILSNKSSSKYSITFVTNGGSTVESIMIDENDKIVKPQDPTKGDYEFLGWYYNGELYDFTKPVTDNMQLEARWEKAENISDIELNHSVLILYLGETTKLVARVFPENTSSKNLIWTSSNPDIVSVDQDGNIKALKEGNATITVTTIDGSYTASSNILARMAIVGNTPTEENEEQKTSVPTTNNYKVTFKDTNGSILADTQTIIYGNKVTKPVNPSKEGHTFLGWYSGNTKYAFDKQVKSNLTLVAKWSKNKYNVTFINEDGTVLESKEAEYGSVPIYTKSVPTKQSDEQYTYTFDGWSPSLTKVKENTTYTAIFKKVLNNYEVSFKDTDGTALISSQTVAYGNKVIEPTIPIKEGYTFLGWYNGNTKYTFDEEIKSNLTLTAKWELNKYTITFVNYDGSILETQTLEHGATPSYSKDVPTKPKDNVYTYSFSGWDKNITTATEDATYTAMYNKTYIDYTITFVNDDGTKLSEETYHYGDTVSLPTNPTKAKTAKYTYAFKAWYPNVTTVKESTTYTATYTETLNSYTVNFIDGDGTTLADSQTIAYGSKATKPSDPSKEGHTFLGWYNGDAKYTFNEIIEANVILTAKWELNKYTITFVNYDGSVLESKQVEYGSIPTYTKDTPIRAKTAKFTYSFAGWEPNITIVKQDITYTTTYTETLNNYTVNFIDSDGTTLANSQTVAYGNKITEPTVPLKEGYTFLGWYNGNTKYTFDEEIKSNLTLTAKWELNKYTITFVNYDGSILETQTLEHGATPSYSKDVPTKPKDNVYTYSFSGWDKNITVATEDTTYTAMYNKTYINYTITFVNDDGTKLSEETYHYGDTVSLPTNPTKAKTAKYTYVFKAWQPNVTTVKQNITYTATYTETLNSYTVNFVDSDGTTLADSQTIAYGSKATKPIDPEKEGYTFIGWYNGDTEYTFNEIIEANVTLTAKWKTSKYTVMFVNYDGSILESQILEHGAIPKYSKDIPTKPSDEQAAYTFAGWTPAITAVKEDVTYTATYIAATNTYKVYFIDEDGSSLASTQTIAYGNKAIKPDSPSKEGYTFLGWYNGYTKYTFNEPVTADITLTAKWELNKYTITFVNYDGSILETQTLEHGATPSYSKDVPTKPKDNVYTYSFSGWDKNITVATEDTTYTATYNKTYINYTITFVNDDGTKLSEKTYHYGDTVSLPTNPTKAKTAKYTYAFKAWYPNVTTVKQSTTYTATYTETLNSYTVIFVDSDGTTLADSQTIAYGSKATKPSDPSKEGHTFLGWYNGDTKYTFNEIIEANVTLTAKWELNKYTITFVNYDGSVLESKEVEYDSIPTYTKDTPIRTKTAKYTYTFAAWYPSITTVKQNATYTTTYTETLNSYTVNFVDSDGTTLVDSQTIAYGSKVTKPSDPSKEGHTFLGWYNGDTKYTFNEIIEANVTLTAKWSVNKYTIKFVNHDGTVLESKEVEYGSTPTYSKDTPTKAKTAKYTYTFAGWEPSVTIVKQDTTYTATFTSKINTYKVLFKDTDGTTLADTQNIEYGNKATKPTTPSKEGHTFLGWYNGNTEYTFDEIIEANVTLTAKWSVNKYTIKFVNYDGTVLESKEVEYGSTPTYTKNTPTKPKDGTYPYIFVGWNQSITKVKKDTTYTAQFKYLVDIDNILETACASVNEKQFKMLKDGNTLTMHFTKYSSRKPPYDFTAIFFEVADCFHQLSKDASYESVNLYYKHPNSSKGQTIDLKDYDLTDTRYSSWYGSGANDRVGDWLGYLATGTASTSAAFNANTGNLIGKTVQMTFELKDGYVFEDGSTSIIYYLTFTTE